MSSEIFAEKVLNAQATSSAAAAKATFEKSCNACQKTYYSENAYQNHVGSQKHRARVTAIEGGEGHTGDDETNSVMSSTISLGEPLESGSTDIHDPEVEKEFSSVVNSMKEASLKGKEPITRRPSRPHHSSNTNDDRTPHPISPATTKSGLVIAEKAPAKDEQISKRCLFCNYDSPNLKLSVMHMTKFHGMFIPEQPYLVDLEGLIGYLHEKVTEYHECLFCHKVKTSSSGVQTHMRDKGHCMIAFDSEEDMIEVGQFYDFRSTYSDDEDESSTTDDDKGTSSGGVKLGSKRTEASQTTTKDANGDTTMGEGDANEDGWETDSSASSLDSAELHAVPIDHDHAYQRLALHRHHSHNDPRPHRTVDGFHSHAHCHHHAAFHSDHELFLPSGRTAGHRSLARYYRQNLHSHPSAQERIERRLLADGAAEDSDEEEDEAQAGRGRQVATRANGGMGMIGVTDAKKREILGVEKREQKRAQRAQKQYQWGVNKRANAQKHFRDPLLQ